MLEHRRLSAKLSVYQRSIKPTTGTQADSKATIIGIWSYRQTFVDYKKVIAIDE